MKKRTYSPRTKNEIFLSSIRTVFILSSFPFKKWSKYYPRQISHLKIKSTTPGPSFHTCVGTGKKPIFVFVWFGGLKKKKQKTTKRQKETKSKNKGDKQRTSLCIVISLFCFLLFVCFGAGLQIK